MKEILRSSPYAARRSAFDRVIVLFGAASRQRTAKDKKEGHDAACFERQSNDSAFG